MDHDHGSTYEFISRAVTFFTDETYVRQGSKWVRIEKPDDAEASTFDDQLLLRLRSDALPHCAPRHRRGVRMFSREL